MRACIVGGGAALAQPLIAYLLREGYTVTAVCRRTRPTVDTTGYEGKLWVVQDELSVQGPIDVLVTCVGAVANARVDDMSVSGWVDGIGSNLTAVGIALSRLMKKVRNGGSVVVFGSVVGSTGGYGCANYAAAKAGLGGLVRAVANEVASRDICVNLLELGFIDSGMGTRLSDPVKNGAVRSIPFGRFGTEWDVVHAVNFLIECRYMTGNTLTLAGGLR